LVEFKSRSKQKKVYADKKRTYQEFQVGDNVYAHVKPKISSLAYGRNAKLAP